MPLNFANIDNFFFMPGVICPLDVNYPFTLWVSYLFISCECSHSGQKDSLLGRRQLYYVAPFGLFIFKVVPMFLGLSNRNWSLDFQFYAVKGSHQSANYYQSFNKHFLNLQIQYLGTVGFYSTNKTMFVLRSNSKHSTIFTYLKRC